MRTKHKKKKEDRHSLHSTENVKVGDPLIMVEVKRIGPNIPWLVEVMKKSPKGTITIKKINFKKGAFLGEPIRFTPSGHKVGETRGGFGAYTYLEELGDYSIDDIKEEIIKDRQKRRAKAKKEQEASNKAKKERREKIEAFWTYKGKELWEKAKEVGCIEGNVKVINCVNRHNEQQTLFVRTYKEEDKFATIEAKEKDSKADTVFELFADYVGYIQHNHSTGLNSVSSTRIRGEDEKELIYDIVH